LDGTVISDIEGGEVTIDNLKSTLKSERKALSTLASNLYYKYITFKFIFILKNDLSRWKKIDIEVKL